MIQDIKSLNRDGFTAQPDCEYIGLDGKVFDKRSTVTVDRFYVYGWEDMEYLLLRGLVKEVDREGFDYTEYYNRMYDTVGVKPIRKNVFVHPSTRGMRFFDPFNQRESVAAIRGRDAQSQHY